MEGTDRRADGGLSENRSFKKRGATAAGQDLYAEARSARFAAERVVMDRLFITEFVEGEHVLGDWREIVDMAPSEADASRQRWTALHSKLVRGALADLGVPAGGAAGAREDG
jgi:hypothetical protein